MPFRHVQMILIHEIAHCVQMNHSKAFWEVRNRLAGELRELWSQGYTGDGFWGKGKKMADVTEEWQGNVVRGLGVEEGVPRSLCGGTYRSWRKRRRGRGKEELSWKEREEKRIQRKFGKNGVALGGDEGVRVKLEDGKRPKGNPRVAGSMRGRELRAAAALARFDQQKVVDEEEVKKEEDDAESDEGSEFDDEDVKYEAFDVDG